MSDIEIAKLKLEGHTICLCKGGNCLFSDRRGIAPMMGFIEQGLDLNGFSVADVVVGKAAAMLFVKCGICEVYARTLSKAAEAVLKAHNIPYSYGTLTERIINREGTDTCPMEKAVSGTDNIEEGYELLKKQLKNLSQ